MTYPNPDVQSFLNERVVPFKPRIDESEELAKTFGMTWTPGLVWLTPDGKACHRNVGYFDPQEFLAESEYGCAHVDAARSDWKAAMERFDDVASTWPNTHAAPAALYWSGVAAKKHEGEVEPLMKRWNDLLERYPKDAWAMKVSFLRDAS